MKSHILLGAGALVTLSALPSYAADTVTVAPPPPFDRWCIQPLCMDEGAAPAPLKPPPPVMTDALGGYAESKLRAAIAEQIDGWVKEHASEWNTKAVRDLARTAIAALSDDSTALQKSQGLATSLLRAGLVFRLEGALSIDDQCKGAARRDAIYEGLSITRALGALTFPESDKTVLSTCKATAEQTVDAIDGAILRALDPGNELAKIVERGKKLKADVDHAVQVCAAVPPSDPAGQSATIKALASAKANPTVAAYLGVVAAVQVDKASLATWADGPAKTCADTVGALVGVDVSPFSSAVGKTLAKVDLGALLEKIDTSPLSCESAACTEAKELLLVARNGLDEKALRTLVAHLRVRLGLTVDESGAFAGALRALDAAIVTTSGLGSIDPAAFVRTLTAEYGLDEDGHIAPLSLIKPGPLVFEANGGVPRLKGDDVKFVGDLTLGWKTRQLGIVGNGALSYYDFGTGTGSTDTTRAHGALDAWWMSGDDRTPVRFEARVSGAVDYYDSTYVPVSNDPTAGYFHDEDSTLARGSVLLGLRVSPSARFLLDLLVGGGMQYESYGYLATNPKDPNVLSDSTAVTGRGNGRVLVRWSVIPQFLSLRGRAEADYFRLTRDLFTVSQINRPLSVTSTTTELEQLEVRARAFLDLDIAKFLGFVPSAWAGFDMVKMRDDAGDVQTTIPVFGLGIVRPTF